MARATTSSKSTTTRGKSSTAAKKSTTGSTAKTAPAKASATVTTSTAAPAAKSPELTVVSEVTPKLTTGEMKKRELIKAVMARSGARQKLAKPVVEAMLSVMGEALAEGRELNLPPMGKVKIQRQKKVSGGMVSVLKLRRTDNMVANTAENAADSAGGVTDVEKAVADEKEPLADSEE